MKYTLLYLRCLVCILLVLIMVASLVIGCFSIFGAIVGSLSDMNPEYLILLPVGIFAGFMGFVAFDAFVALIEKWRLKA